MADFSAISQLAYEMWEKGGRRDGTAEQNWLEAERILASRARAALTPLTADAVDHLLTPPGLPAPAAPPPRARKRPANSAAKPSAGATAGATAKSSGKHATVETPKVGSRDAPGG